VAGFKRVLEGMVPLLRVLVSFSGKRELSCEVVRLKMAKKGAFSGRFL